MPQYTFRANVNTLQGALHLADLDQRVLASLEDAEADGIAVVYDWHSAEIGQDDAGDFVKLSIEWPNDLRFGDARRFIDRHSVTVDWDAA